MALTEGVVGGVIGALGWGSGDFAAKFSIDRIGPLRTFFWVQLVGLILLFALLPFFPFEAPRDVLGIALILLAGLLNATAFISFYRGFSIGKVSIVSPIAGSASAVTVLLGLLFLSEWLTFAQGVGVIVILAGIILASASMRGKAEKGRAPVSRGIPEAVYSMMAWGSMWFVIALVEKSVSWLPVLIGMRMTGVALALALASFRGGLLQEDRRLPLAAFSASALLEVLAFVAVMSALETSFSSIVVPISHAYPAVTALLALIILKEKPSKSQLAGVAAILLGIAALSL